MFRLFLGDHRRSSASAPTDCSSSSKDIVPGGPSPDSPFSPHNTGHEASALEAADASARSQTGRTFGNMEGSTESKPGVDNVHMLQPSQHHLAGVIHAPQGTSQSTPDPKSTFKKAGKDSQSRPPGRLPDAHLENTPTIAAAGERADGPRSASVASRRTNRSVAINNVSGSAFASGAATATNESPDVDPSLQARVASAEDELRPREKAAISKEERMFSSRFYIVSMAVLMRAGWIADGVGRKLSKIIKSEAKAEKAALHVALKELAEIQKLQKASIKVRPESVFCSYLDPSHHTVVGGQLFRRRQRPTRGTHAH